MPVDQLQTTEHAAGFATLRGSSSEGLQGWLEDWGHWINLWQQADTQLPGHPAWEALRRWKDRLPAQSFPELHALADQLLEQSATLPERLETLRILENWQRAMVRLNKCAQ